MDKYSHNVANKLKILNQIICDMEKKKININDIEHLKKIKNSIFLKFINIYESNKEILYYNIYLELMEIITLYSNKYNLGFFSDGTKLHENLIKEDNLLCKNCLQKLIYIDNNYSCQHCGEIYYFDIDCKVNIDYYYKENSNIIRHYNKQIDNLLGRDKISDLNIDEQNKLINIIKTELKNKGILLQTATPEDIRIILKKNKKSNFYKHTSLLLYLITGRKPPDISKELLDRARKIFNLISLIKKDIDNNNNNNSRNYYSYVIYLIFNAILKDPEDRRILEFIHLQSENTINNHNKELKIINKELINRYGISIF